MNSQQVKAIIKLLKRKHLVGRPALKKVFEQGGHLWATDGYVLLDICEVKEELYGKQVGLDELLKWYAVHRKATDCVPNTIFTNNEENVPDISSLIKGKFKPKEGVLFRVDDIVLACEFLGIQSVSLDVNSVNENLYMIKPVYIEEIPIMIRALESKAYVMGLTKK